MNGRIDLSIYRSIDRSIVQSLFSGLGGKRNDRLLMPARNYFSRNVLSEPQPDVIVSVVLR